MGLSAYSTVEEYRAGALLETGFPSEHVLAGLGQVVHDRAGANGRGIHLLEGRQGSGALVVSLDACQEPVAVEVAHGGDRYAEGGHGSGEASSEADAC